MKRFRRRLGTVLIVLGAVALAYGATVYFWKDPITSLYASWKQSQLTGTLDESFAKYRSSADFSSLSALSLKPAASGSDVASTAPSKPSTLELEQAIHRAAQHYFSRLQPGQAIGRIVIPKLGIDPVFVNGTSWADDLSRGPGRYPQTSVPGLGKVTAIAGHRTTFGAWFRNIDSLKPGDPITLELPYGTFHYRVFGYRIVDNDDWSIIKPRGFDTLVLSACHPLYSASHRYVVFARLAKVDIPDGVSYSVGGVQQVAAAAPAAG